MSERKFPCLFDRLTREAVSHQDRFVRLEDYKRGVERDLQWLLSTGQPFSRDDLKDFENTYGSVVNFGRREITGMPNADDYAAIARDIRESINRFEPRLVKESLRVTIVESETKLGKMVFEISGQLWSLDRGELLYLQLEMDVETGVCIKKTRSAEKSP